MITSTTFASQDQVLGYFNSNIQEITTKTNLRCFDDLEEDNYYLLEEDGKQPNIVLVESKTDFYVSVTKILMKKTGQDVFSKIPSPTKININNGIFENKISNGYLHIKHIDSNTRIKIAMRPISTQTFRPLVESTDLPGPTSVRAPTSPTSLTNIPPVEGGPMIDYIRYQQMHLIEQRPRRNQGHRPVF